MQDSHERERIKPNSFQDNLLCQSTCHKSKLTRRLAIMAEASETDTGGDGRWSQSKYTLEKSRLKKTKENKTSNPMLPPPAPPPPYSPTRISHVHPNHQKEKKGT
jgi:hypothetical protein